MWHNNSTNDSTSPSANLNSSSTAFSSSRSLFAPARPPSFHPISSFSSSSSPTSSLPPSSNDADKVKEINSLHHQLAELQAKYETQHLQLQTIIQTQRQTRQAMILATEASKQSSENDENESTVPDPSSLLSSASDPLPPLQQRLSTLLSHNASLHSTILSLTDELTTLRSTLSSSLSERQSLHEKNIEIVRQFEGVKKEVERMKKEMERKEERVKELEGEVTSVKVSVMQYQQKWKEQQGEIDSVNTLRNSNESLEQEVTSLRTVLIDSQQQSNQKLQSTYNQLYSTKQFLEELKIEYESYSNTSRQQYNEYVHKTEEEMKELREKLARQSAEHLESLAEQARELAALLSVLQAQFNEYRHTAESLFSHEANALHQRLQSQQYQHTLELQQLCRLKDLQFNTMCRNKDAKLMSIIDGSDLQQQLIIHTLEMEEIKKEGEKKCKKVKEEVEMEAKKGQQVLVMELNEMKERVERLQVDKLEWERKVEENVIQFKKINKSYAAKQQQSLEEQKQLQLQLNQAHEQIQELIQVKENLRHRILRLRLQQKESLIGSGFGGGMNGVGGSVGMVGDAQQQSLQSIINSLTKEQLRLSTSYALLSQTSQQQTSAHTLLQQQYQTAQIRLQKMEKEMERRSKEYRKLTETFERFLRGRMRGKGWMGGESKEREEGEKGMEKEMKEIRKLLGKKKGKEQEEEGESEEKRNRETERGSESDSQQHHQRSHSSSSTSSSSSSSSRLHRRSVILQNQQLVSLSPSSTSDLISPPSSTSFHHSVPTSTRTSHSHTPDASRPMTRGESSSGWTDDSASSSSQSRLVNLLKHHIPIPPELRNSSSGSGSGTQSAREWRRRVVEKEREEEAAEERQERLEELKKEVAEIQIEQQQPHQSKSSKPTKKVKSLKNKKSVTVIKARAVPSSLLPPPSSSASLSSSSSSSSSSPSLSLAVLDQLERGFEQLNGFRVLTKQFESDKKGRKKQEEGMEEEEEERRKREEEKEVGERGKGMEWKEVMQRSRSSHLHAQMKGKGIAEQEVNAEYELAHKVTRLYNPSASSSSSSNLNGASLDSNAALSKSESKESYVEGSGSENGRGYRANLSAMNAGLAVTQTAKTVKQSFPQSLLQQQL